ncbi:MAG TPA: hypothetical protein VKA48_08780, partial [Gammaproteobacteria bacterium]|nr:hypothetical protein [Gammaproteobacteria bacterium]
MQVRHGVLVAALLVLAAPAAHSGGERDKAPADLAREGVQAYAQEDYGRARHLLRRAAEAGAPRAQYYLGRMYSWGHGVQRDETIASRWILKAARGGFRHAQEVIAARYMDGTGLPRDH